MNPYPSYKDSGVEWIGEIPRDWDFVRLKYLFSLEGGKDSKSIQLEDGQYPILGTGGEISRGSDFLYDKPTLLLGRKGTIDKPFLYNEPFWVSDVMYYTIQKKDVTPKYLYLLFTLIPFDYYRYGSTQPSMSRLDYESMYFPVPPLQERQKVIKYLDTKTQKIDELIEKTEQKIELLKEKRLKLIEDVILNQKTERVRLEYVVDLIKRPINRDNNKTYNKIGMYNWGRGIFKYPSELGSELGDSTFNFIKEDDLLLSGQFSWEGSVSMVEKEVDNCISSHRFHILMGKENILLNEYLWSYFTSQEGHSLLTENSFGSSGRNQPLNIGRLLKEKVPIPDLSIQKEIKKFVQQTREFEKYSKKRIELLKEYRQSLISEVVTGKVDVRDYNG
jgi:type I restriction enzyme, S subunit